MRISAVNDFNVVRPQVQDTKAISFDSFESILYDQGHKSSVEEMFSNIFPTYNVSCKIGNCDVSSADWQRNDFPSWRFFDDKTKAEELNSWKSSGTDTSFSDKSILNAWNRTDNRKMVIIIPDELAAKMQSNPSYAKQVLDKVYSWQINHAALEQSLSEGYGYDGPLSNFEDSYLLKLDKEGNVSDYVVTGPGYDSSFKTEERSPSADNPILKTKKRINPESEPVKSQAILGENISERRLYDYPSAVGILAAAWLRKKQI
ncbi:hypothetical protein Ami103574_05720 [Aminipila butyrica]|uniref:Uncharacterized protein n=1 Tax=Aminipila butyrica TaxID=433296 RepID=A0A858BU36_9FIRM|nr:hypothetical protein [Aminipila butyrica]QIB68852.1 hypothetical protein Ami103574_05720 [Aminipila butyrica]